LTSFTSYIYFAQIEKYYIETLFLNIEAIQNIGYDMAERIIKLSNLDGTNGFKINGIDAFDRSGVSVSSAGDVNGDGFDDI
jgi:hypothetical protein